MTNASTIVGSIVVALLLITSVVVMGCWLINITYESEYTKSFINDYVADDAMEKERVNKQDLSATLHKNNNSMWSQDTAISFTYEGELWVGVSKDDWWHSIDGVNFEPATLDTVHHTLMGIREKEE